MKDVDDRTRFLLVSGFSPSIRLYYDISEDTYVINEPAGGTLFKRRSTALAIQRLLGGRVEIQKCRVAAGRLVLRLEPRLAAPGFLRERGRRADPGLSDSSLESSS